MRWETLLVILADASITHWPNAELCSSKRNGDENLSLDGLVWSGPHSHSCKLGLALFTLRGRLVKQLAFSY